MDLLVIKHKLKSTGWTAIDLTETIEEYVKRTGFRKGLVHVFTLDRNCCITFIEYEPSLLKDLEEFIKKLGLEPPIVEGLLGKNITAPFIDGSLETGVFKRIILLDLNKTSGERTVVLSIEGIHGNTQD